MGDTKQSRRRFMKGAGLAMGSVVGSAVLPEAGAAQSVQRSVSQTPRTRAARFRAGVASPEGFVLPVVTGVMMARLCELEGFTGGFMGGSGFALQYALPNLSLGTLTEVMSYMNQVIENTDLPILADAEDGGGSPVIVYRVVQGFERAGAACIMIEDAVDPRTHFNSKGAPVASAELMVNRVKAAVDARKDQDMMILIRSDAPTKGYPEQHTLDLAAACSAAGADAFYLAGFSLDQQQKAKALLKKPLMVGSSGPASEWKSKGVDMAYYHVETVALGAIHMALKELKTTGKFIETAKMRLAPEINAKLIDDEAWRARAKKYGMMM